MTIGDLIDPTRAGAALTVAGAMLSALPFAGGPIAVALGEIQRSRDHRLADLVIDVSERIRDLGDSLDRDYVTSAEFARRLETVLDEATRARQATKRQYWARAIAGTAIRERPGDDEWDLLIDALERVQRVHLAVLAGLAAGPSKPMTPDEVFTVGSGAWRAIEASVPDLSRDLLYRVWEDFAQMGIVESLTIVTTDQRTSTDVPSVIQPFGRRFIAFLALDVRDFEEGLG